VSRAKGNVPPIRFRGTPSELSAKIRDWDAPSGLAVRLKQGAIGKALPEELIARRGRGEGSQEVRLRLPRHTPPGAYEGVVDTAEGERPVRIEVEPEIELDIVPGQLLLTGAPGERVSTELTLSNLGNVTVEIRRAYQLGLYAIGGLERAIRRAFAEPGEAQGANRVFDHMADEHGGLVRIEIGEGAGDLEPGMVRDLSVTFRLPDGLDPARTYAGTWALYDLRYYVQVMPLRAKKEGK
jgi:hypothetical protein